jgi:uncharacterized protein (TIGR02284 family)
MAMDVVIKMVSLDETVLVLNHLIRTWTDSQKGYAEASADARDPMLKTRLMNRSLERGNFVVTLQEIIEAMGRVPVNEGTAKAALHRGWMLARQGVGGRSDRHVVEECVRGEQAALGAVMHLFAKTRVESLPKNVRALVQRQVSLLEEAHQDLVRELAPFDA